MTDTDEMKLFIAPQFNLPDAGDGGIRRVVEAQRKYLPLVGVTIVDDIHNADVCAYHGGTWMEPARGTPVVSHCHGLYWQEYQWDSWAHDLNSHVVNALRRADAATAPSKWVAHAIQRGMLIDPLVVYHGIEADDWHAGTREREPYVLWNKTRVDSVCNPDDVDKLAALATDVRFVTTYGRPSDNVSVTGKLPYEQGKQFIQEASVYLCTARETFGIGTLEAMACETPILGWKWGGQAEFIEHEVTGYLARPGDFDDLRRGLSYCLDNRVRLGQAARKIVETKFTWQLAMEKYVTLYRQLMRQATKDARSPRVSVVITCYNLGTTLPRAVASIQKQEDFDPAQAEIVIVNDNSPDDTAEVAERIRAHPSLKNPIKVVTNESNLYLSDSLNAGIANASGKYIIPLDADNELGPRCLRLLSDALDKDRGLHIAYGAMQVIDESGTNAPFVSTWPGQFNYVEQMRHRNQLPSTSMYRRSIWSRIGGYRRRCRTAEDADFWCRATSFGAVPRRVTDAVCLIYHDRSESMSHTERDWDWAAWYSWGRDPRRTPFGAAQNNLVRVAVPSYEPALVTVVIPVGPGHAKYVIDAIDSLIAQTYQNWRCVVVWDSPDPVPYLPPFVQFVGLPRAGSGPAVARNAGIEASHTPLFLPLDADDYLQPEALAALIAAFKAGNSNEYYYSDWYIQETGERKDTLEFNCERIKDKMPHAVTALYTKESWESVGGFDESLDSWEDWDFLISLVKSGYCGVRVPHALFYYRMQAGSRREEKYAASEINAQNLAEKHKFLTETTPMGCGCGGGKPRMPASNGASATMIAPGNNGDMVKLEFQGEGGARTYKGQATGREYRFGADQSHKWRYVHQADAAHLLRRPEFKVSENPEAVVVSDARLEAVGPPTR